MLDWLSPMVLLLLPAPLLVRRWLPPFKHNTTYLRIPSYTQLQQLQQNDNRRLINGLGDKKLNLLIALTMWICLLLAAARPVWFGEPVSVSNEGRDLLLALDLSDSMKIKDMVQAESTITRIEAIKQVASEFIERRHGDRIGLIVFGQHSYLQSPLTFDRASVAIQLNEALPGFAGSSTAIGDALGMGIKLLRNRPSEGRVLVLLTDGANTAGSDPVVATSVASESGIRVHTIGVGADSMETTDVAGAAVVVDPSRDLDESTLQLIAEQTGGRYFRARDPAQMERIYATIDELEPVPDSVTLRPQRSLFHWPLSLALLCAVVVTFLRFRFGELA